MSTEKMKEGVLQIYITRASALLGGSKQLEILCRLCVPQILENSPGGRVTRHGIVLGPGDHPEPRAWLATIFIKHWGFQVPG